MTIEEREKKAKKRARSRAIAQWMWISAGIIIVCVYVFFILVYNGLIGYMPPIKDLKDPKSEYASVIYSSDGVEMGRFFRNKGNHSSNRVYADYDSISNYVFDALVATEDARFEDHSGIDFRALSRVAFKNILLGRKSAGGGSTITQQLAKQLYSTPTTSKKSRIIQKPIEWMIALKLERYYSKEEIIKMYLNQFDFLYNAVGIQTAAHVYFNKSPKELNLQESAMLVGMVKNPSVYNPRLHPEAAKNRRNVVLDQMYKAGKITREERDSVSQLPIELNFRKINHKDGIAPYFREELRRYLTAKKPVRKDYPKWDYARFVTDSTLWETNALYGWVAKNPKADGTYWDIYKDGLRIYTTIDATMQAYADSAVSIQLKDLQRRFDREKGREPATRPYTSNRGELSDAGRKRLIQSAINQSERARVAKLRGLSEAEIEKEFNTPFDMTLFSWNGPVDTVMTPRDSILYTKGILKAGFMAMDPRNGHVKAYVGGPDFSFYQYDMVSTGKRQVGSTIKPFLYARAMEREDITPCTMFSNTQPVFQLSGGRTWMPRNASTSRVGEDVDLRWALTNSNNWISARLIDKIGPKVFAESLKNYGITSKVVATPALSLGAAEISLIEMVSAYSTFANEGMRTQPMFVTSITDSDGLEIANFTPEQSEVITRNAYYRILSMLLGVVDSGTGHRLRSMYGITAPTGGKTGTTNYNADGWFMAFTPSLVAGTWVGGDDKFIHFNSMRDGQGAEMALPIYGRFMQMVYRNPSLGYSQSESFVFPPDVELCPKDIVEEEPEEQDMTSSSLYD